MNKSTRHKRERIQRGTLNSFSELPFCAQNNFKKIAKEINELVPETTVYVFGSYHWGFWDKESDYDVILDKHPFLMNKHAFRQHFENKFDIKADIVPGGATEKLKKQTTLIEIPL